MSHIYFDVFISAVIALNSVIIGVEVDYMTRHKEQLEAFFILQTICSAIFLVEISIRLFAVRLQFFTGSEMLWNYLDLVLVLASCVEILVKAFGLAGSDVYSKAKIIRIMRVMKTVRILRITRIVRFIRALRIMLHSIMDTLKSVVWAMFLLCMIMYFFGIIITQAVSDHLKDTVEDGQIEQSLKEHWHSLSRSMLTLFKAVTGGMDWGSSRCSRLARSPSCQC